MMRRLFGLFTLGAAGAVFGAAASLAVTSGTLGAATTATPRCTAVGLSILQNLTGASVTSITVSGLPSACGTATLQVAVHNGATSSTGSAAVPAGGGSVLVALGTAVAVSTAEQTDIVLVGP